ncbi:hypothetical protein CHO01_10560 [Cellulomonas hominis]|uniref:Uncharacterized protein n=1 Tax=Cellulomonas hominis TaxID=156981 RepID=A0A511F9J8_9CELL|nr:hypothetical protein CHO01_10560 [Cellulomonas hominis]
MRRGLSVAAGEGDPAGTARAQPSLGPAPRRGRAPNQGFRDLAVTSRTVRGPQATDCAPGGIGPLRRS